MTAQATPSLEILKGARELLSDPTRWAKGYYAYTADGQQTSPVTPEAACFCVWGALDKVTGTFFGPDAFAAGMYLGNQLPEGWPSLANFNDAEETTHADLLALFDKAIESAALSQATAKQERS
jgi:hypothetical protein